MPLSIAEPARETPIAATVDVCVLGGSCTGVFAAVRAARLGASVALVEAQNCFGGTATAGLVNVWHSLKDVHFDKQIVAGLTEEVVERLDARGALRRIERNVHGEFKFNPEDLKMVLDQLVGEHADRLRPFLHARFVAAAGTPEALTHAIIEDKSGRRAIAARVFVDATGDGDVLVRGGLGTRLGEHLQPATGCFLLEGLAALWEANPDLRIADLVFDPQTPGALRPGFLWHADVPGRTDTHMIAGTRAWGRNCSDADDLTAGEMETRAQADAIYQILRRQKGGEKIHLAGFCQHIGCRQSRHADGLHRVTGEALLRGNAYEDTIAVGTYPVDIHQDDQPGIVLRYLDGRERRPGAGGEAKEGRWLPEGAEPAPFYQVPYRSLVPKGATNVLAAGRLVDADADAYGALRVMVNCNQYGEAAGVAAAIACEENLSVADVPAGKLRAKLVEGGSLIPGYPG